MHPLRPSSLPLGHLPWQVGGMRNQAFVEFASIEQAMAIVTHFQRSGQPAQLRGRPTWLSYR